MATSLGKLMTNELGTMEPLKLINAIHQIFLSFHLLSRQQDCTPLPALCRSPPPSHGRDHVIFLVNELQAGLPSITFRLKRLIPELSLPLL